jgi:hypothetical protein
MMGFFILNWFQVFLFQVSGFEGSTQRSVKPDN